nr:MAG TPA: hypothetical protein [Caudoviricetes sp.]
MLPPLPTRRHGRLFPPHRLKEGTRMLDGTNSIFSPLRFASFVSARRDCKKVTAVARTESRALSPSQRERATISRESSASGRPSTSAVMLTTSRPSAP